MRSIQRFFYFKRSLPQRKRGFTLLEVTVALCLAGIFAVLLLSSLYQVIKFVGGVSARTRQCWELRKLCEFLTTDCRKLFLCPTRSSLELQVSSEDDVESSLLLLRQLSSSWEDSFLISQAQENATCALVQYRFYPKKGIICRHIWKAQAASNFFANTEEVPLKEALLSQESAISSRNLVQNVAHFQLYAIDSLGQRQTQWMQGSSKGLEYEVTFRSIYQRRRQKFYTRIPILPMGENERIFP